MNEFNDNRIVEDRLEMAKRRKRNNRIGSVLVMFGCLIALVLVTYLAGLAYMWIDDAFQKNAQEMADAASADLNGEKTTYTRQELNTAVEEAVAAARKEANVELLEGIKEALSKGNLTMVEMLRPYYEDELVVVSSGAFHFVPINESLRKNDYNQENLKILDSGEYQYVEDGQVTSHKGIDVSKFQGDIDWEAVAADGVEFAFIRVGNRGYGAEGNMLADDRFEENVEGALKAGIKVGVYFYTQALNEEELLEEAEFVLEKIAPYKIECPVVYDVEKVSGANGRMNALSAQERTDLTLLFCQTIEEAGYKPMIYHNMEMGALMLNLDELEAYDKWFAYYNGDMYYPYDYKIWQYSHTGRVNGIEGDVDLNISFEPLWD